MKILILGGTIFLGRHLAETALARGHSLTLFNRGEHEPQLFPQTEKLRGNRDGNLTALEGRSWDAVIDTSGYVPRLVGDSARLLANSVGHYTFISSLAVYRDFLEPGCAETATLAAMPDPTSENVAEYYGPLKALCEQTAEEYLPGRTLAVRAGYIVGPNDPTDRFTYWPRRVVEAAASADRRMLAPAPANRLLQVIDVRDLAEWIIRQIETNTTGPFNVTGPAQPLTLAQLLEVCSDQLDAEARVEVQWVTDKFIQQKAGIDLETAFPLCVGENDQEYTYIHSTNIEKALAHGLSFRPMAATVADTLAWDATRLPETRRKVGLERSQELELLKEV